VVCELVTDDRGVIASAAGPAAALLAIDDRFLIGKPLASFVSEPDRRRFRNLLLELERGGELEVSLMLARRDHTAVAADVVASRNDGRIRWTLTAADVVTPAVADPSAGVAERWARRLLNRLSQGIVVVDAGLHVLFVNPAARRLLGSLLRAGEPLPDPWHEFPLRNHARTLFGQRPAVGRRLIDLDDQTIAIEGLTSLDRQTASLVLADVTRDVQNRRADQEFVENAAHELRTPVAAILSVVDALDSGAKDEPVARDRFLQHLRRQADRLSRLATSLLLLRRTQEGADQPHLDLIAARPLLEEVAAGLEAPRQVAVRVNAAPELAVLADHDLLRHALDNIAGNAARHTSQGEIVLEAHDLDRVTELEVRDTGAGMSEADLALAFERFHRAQGSSGVGLGLAIAKEAVEAIGGTIEIDSRPGAGTRVRIRLPSARLVS
jgi:signal transduction histidine kinase